eukprot:TRINITY_DN6791_c0_g1_i2.p8 TRINITY_DN6791_c0_g1~~TRINITY_DN6791_c0_g1_i2.p8  ORF type:complete len:100 (-),score=0.92 TRINITY_DN6791_c0_g1_i2:92-391(-)
MFLANNTREQWPDFGCEGIKVQRAHQPTSQCSVVQLFYCFQVLYGDKCLYNLHFLSLEFFFTQQCRLQVLRCKKLEFWVQGLGLFFLVKFFSCYICIRS